MTAGGTAARADALGPDAETPGMVTDEPHRALCIFHRAGITEPGRGAVVDREHRVPAVAQGLVERQAQGRLRPLWCLRRRRCMRMRKKFFAHG